MAQRVIIAILLLVFTGACASGGTRIETGPFPQTVDELGDVDQARLVAREEGKLLLIVLGANWCHDSKALIASLEDPEIAPLVEEKFERVLINVGTFERGFAVADLIGLPIYAHTPTMLIVEPGTGALVNWDDHYIFRDAASLDREEVTNYLEEHSQADVRLVEPEVGRDEIDEWAAVIATRIRDGYRQLATYEAFEGEAFNADWKALRTIRYGFSSAYPEALLELSQAGNPGELPEYAPLPWE